MLIHHLLSSFAKGINIKSKFPVFCSTHCVSPQKVQKPVLFISDDTHRGSLYSYILAGTDLCLELKHFVKQGVVKALS